MRKTWLLVFALVGSALGQNHLVPTAPGAATGPAFDLSAGYSYLTMTMPNSGRVNLSGLDAAGRIDFRQHWGATVDASYVRTSNVLGTQQGGYLLSLMAGPVFYPFEHGNTRLFLHGLAGAGLVESAVPTSGSQYLHGWVARPAYALGGGFEHTVFGPFAVRFSGDYLRTAYIDSTDIVRNQNNLRLTGSLVFRLKEHPRGVAY